MSENEYREYQRNMTTKADIRNAMAYAVKEGRAQGIAEGREEGKAQGIVEGRAEAIEMIAINCKHQGLPIEMIARITGLTEEQISKM